MPRSDAQPAVEGGPAVPAAPERAPLGPALEPNLYIEPEIVRLEQEAIFERTWQLAGHVADLSEPGSYLTTDIVDQPVLVVRDHDGEIRAFRNVCRHRGSRLLSGSGSCGKAIRCLYHGWTYRLDGRLIGVPEGREIADLDKSRLGLHQVRAEVFCGLIFVNLDPGAEPLGERLGGLAERLARYDLPALRRFGRGGTTQPANWKLVVENYIEGYHIPIAHPSLMRLLDYQRYDVEVHDDWVWFEAPMRDKPSDNRLERLYQRLVRPAPGLGPDDRRVWRFVLIYPNTTIDLYPDQVNTWRLLPDGANVTRDEWGTFRHPDAPTSSRVVQRINNVLNTTVLKEDVDLVDNVQRGIRSRGYRPGPLSHREAAVAWFAERIRADLERAVE
jgi:phenylpropionate dioxygenase-like ring-hydroxylating dioxygenase large terminal subunit